MPAFGQEALRASLASAQSAAARRQAVTQIGYYNLRLGDMTMRFGSGLGFEYTDNANLREDDPQSDFIISPSFNTSMLWPITDRNTLNLTFGVGYSLYLKEQDLSRFYLSPGTELSIDFYIGDFVINLHERPSISQYAYQDPSVSGTGDYAQFQNVLGMSALWDLNKAELSCGYDHNNYVSLSTGARNRDGESDLFYVRGGVDIYPEVQIGLEGGAGMIQYTEVTTPDAFQWNFGGYVNFTASQYMNFRVNVGYTVYSPEKTGAFAALSDTSLIYADLAINHRLNQYVTYTLAGGRGVNLSFYGQTSEDYHASLNADWHILKDISVSTPFSWTRATELYGSTIPYNQFMTGISFGRELTQKLSTTLGYRLVVRDSGTATGNYVANSVSLSFSYRF